MCMDKQNIMEGYEEANNQTICVNVSMTHVIAREKRMIKAFNLADTFHKNEMKDRE